MSFYTESSIVLAFNTSKDLMDRLYLILKEYNKLCNGANGTFIGPKVDGLRLIKLTEGSINIAYTEHEYVSGYTVPAYSGYGATGDEEDTYHPGYATSSEKFLTVPFHLILKSTEELTSYLKELDSTWKAEQAEKDRLKKIEHLKFELAKLEARASKI